MIIEYSLSSSSISLDERSISSTLEVHSVSHPTKIAFRRCKHRKCVTFKENANVFYSSPFQNKTKTKSLWFTARDYQNFKDDNMSNLANVIRLERDNKKNHQSYLKVLRRVFNVLCQKDSTAASVPLSDSQRLRELLSFEYVGRIGLEKTCVLSFRLDKQSRRQQLLDVVLQVQEDNGISFACANERAENLALVVQEISRPSRLLAACIAAAAHA